MKNIEAYDTLQTKMKALKKIIGIIIFRPYYIIRSGWPVWFWALNYAGWRAFFRARPRLDIVQKRIAEDLREQGISITHIDELFPGEGKLAELQRYAEGLRPGAKVREGKPFLKMLWEDNPVLDVNNPYTELSLHSRVLNIVNTYMGMCTRFDYSTLDITTPVPPDSDAFRSQNWHRDRDDKKMCKMFLYLNDVDESAGPFFYATATTYGQKRGRLFPQRPPKGSYPSEKALMRIIPRDEIIACTGKAGTLVFADTSGLHKGGFAKEKERVMFTSAYTSRAAMRSVFWRRPKEEGLAALTSRLGAQAQFAVDAHVGVLLRVLNKMSDISRRYELH